MEKIKSVKLVFGLVLNISLGGILFGYTIGSYNYCMFIFKILNKWEDKEELALNEGIITSAIPLGMIIGSLISGLILDKLIKHRVVFIFSDI